MSPRPVATDSQLAVAIVTGGSTHAGREVARGLASAGWAIVVVYLRHQRAAEATVAEIIAAKGTTVAVRADLADDLDLQRLFAESIAAFGGVDAVVHTTTDSASLLFEHAARHVGGSGAIVSVGRSPPEAVICFLDSWRRHAIG